MHKTWDYDMVIVGGGPAGAMLARLLPKGYRVLLLDKKPLMEEITSKDMKCCGALLSEAAQKVLAEWQMALPAEVLTDPQPFAMKVIETRILPERTYLKQYYNMDRAKFETWLKSLIPSEIEIAGNLYIQGFRRCEKGVLLYGKEKGSGHSREITARLVVAADGASSLFRQRLYPRLRWKMYLSMQEWYENIGGLDSYYAIADTETTDFYSWMIPKGKEIILGTALDEKDGNYQERFRGLKRKLEERGIMFGKRVHREACQIVRPVVGMPVTGNACIALIGEAGGFISPSSAEGFSYAFRSAEALAKAIRAKGLQYFAEQYRHNCREIRRDLTLRQWKSRVMYQPVLRKMALKLGWGSFKNSPAE